MIERVKQKNNMNMAWVAKIVILQIVKNTLLALYTVLAASVIRQDFQGYVTISPVRFSCLITAVLIIELTSYPWQTRP